MARRYVDLHLCLDVTEDTEGVLERARRMMERARDYDLSIVCFGLRVSPETPRSQYKLLRREILEAARGLGDLEVLVGAEIVVDEPQKLRGLVEYYREVSDILMVKGGDPRINRAAVENPRVDVLTSVHKSEKGLGIDHVMARFAHARNVAFEVPFYPLVHTRGRQRSIVLSNLRRVIALARHYGAPVVVTSGAWTEWDIRTGKELASLGTLLGMSLPDALDSVSIVPESIVTKNRNATSELQIMPGVRLVTEHVEKEKKDSVEDGS